MRLSDLPGRAKSERLPDSTIRSFPGAEPVRCPAGHLSRCRFR